MFTDHKPSEGMLSERKPLPSLAAARVQRWAIKLSAYNYTFKYKPASEMTNADALSQLPLSDTEPDNDGTEVLDVFFTKLDKSPIRADEVKTFSRRNPIIGKIMGWL